MQIIDITDQSVHVDLEPGDLDLLAYACDITANVIVSADVPSSTYPVSTLETAASLFRTCELAIAMQAALPMESRRRFTLARLMRERSLRIRRRPPT